MKYYACVYVTGYTTVDGWRVEEDKKRYRVGTGSDKYLIIDGRLKQENARDREAMG